MTNILLAIKNIIENPIVEIRDFYSGRNRINSIGNALEEYIKDAFAGTFKDTDLQERMKKHARKFSYFGNQNNPPDCIIKNGDAIEVKKLQSMGSSIALNSSYPKAKLFADSPLIIQACRECENWKEKDIIYAIGVTSDTKLKVLWLIYGNCYAADRSVYERIRNVISHGIQNISDVEFTETNELGKVKKVDPLGITDLRIRGMWHILNPKKVFNYIYNLNDRNTFKLIALMREDKFNEFPQKDRDELYNIKNKSLSITSVNIKDPNNPVKFIDSKLITYEC